MMQANVTWKGKMAFESQIRGHESMMDAKSEHGGENQGPSPKELLLASIIGCTAMDVVSLMTKMRVEFESFSVQAEADTTEDYPKVFKQVNLVYRINGTAPDLAKVKKSVDLSLTQYCGVSAMISKVSPIVYTITINGENAAEGKADFWSEK